MIHFKKITIIGVGLIGGSFARVCREKKLADHVAGFGRGERNLKRAVEMNVIDSYSLDVKEAVSAADLIFIAAPVMAMADIIKDALPYIKPKTIFTDAGSVKVKIIKEIEDIVDGYDIYFVGAHPIAGTENSGVEASFSGLFEGSKCILTPTENTNKDALGKVEEVWKKMGAKTIIMDANLHDHILAAVSHLPHVIAYSLVNAVGSAIGNCADIRQFSAGGLKDITRIASSDPAMWRDICLSNKENVVRCIDLFQTALQEIKDCVKKDNHEELETLFRAARDIRKNI